MKERIYRISCIIGLLGLWILLFQGIDLVRAKDPDYPTKPITLYIPYGAGGTQDVAFRAFAEVAPKYLGQPLVCINKAGAAGTLAAMAVITSKPDGYTLASVTPSPMFIAPFFDECPYKDLSGFTMVANVGEMPYPFLVRSDSPWKTWKEFIEWARKNPKAAKLGITGAKSSDSQAFVMVQVEKQEKVEFTYIPFKSAFDALVAVLGGHITGSPCSMTAAHAEYMKSGAVRVLAYISAPKVPGFDNVPSTQELYGFSVPNVMGLAGPKDLPNYVLEKWDDVCAKMIKEPVFINAMNKMYVPIVYRNRFEMRKHVDETFEKAGKVIKMLRAEEAEEKKP